MEALYHKLWYAVTAVLHWSFNNFRRNRVTILETRLASTIGAKELLKYASILLLLAMLPVIPYFIIPTSASTFIVKATGTFIFAFVVVISARSLVAIIYGAKNTQNKINIKQFPSVSIVVPSYNEEKVLERTIRSMQELDYPREKIEMIYVYESECTDRTEEIILNFAKEDQRIKPIKRIGKKGGKATAANYGIQHAIGDIIVTLDADHSLKADALKRAIVWFQNPDVVCIKGRCRGINKNASFFAKLCGIERDIVERLHIYSSYKFHGFSIFGGGQAFFRKDIFDTLGEFNEIAMTEDVDYSVKLHLEGHNIIVDPKIESWEENPSNLTAWWHQRRRWSRGWIQVARKYTTSIIRSKEIGFVKKVDMVMGLSTSPLSIITPIMLPLVFISVLQYKASFFPDYLAFPFWLFAIMIPFIIGLTSWYLDIREGEKPRWDEIPYLFLLLPYFIFHGLVSSTAFIDEFILKKKLEYVKTTRDSS